MKLLKSASATLAAASLLGLASLAPAQAQTGYPGPQGITPGTNLPYPGPQAATPNSETTYPAARPGYAAAPSEMGYPAAPSEMSYPAAPPQTGYAAPPSQMAYPAPQPMANPGPETGYAAQGANTQLITNGPQANVEQQQPNWSARQNVMQSHHYTRLIESDRAFRDARIRKECGPISDPQLHQQCLASFDRYTSGSAS